MNLIQRLEAGKVGMTPENARVVNERVQWLIAMTLPQGGPATSETDTLQRIRVRAAEMGYGMYRNNSGVLKNDAGTPVRYGLGNDSAKLNKVWKSGDLVGIGPGGVFVMLDAKHPGWTAPNDDRSRAQWAAMLEIVNMGGLAFFATSVDDYIRQIQWRLK